MTSAEQRGGTVVPVFHVLNPKGEDKGHDRGQPGADAAWAAAAPATLDRPRRCRAEDLQLLTSIQHADPNSLYNRIARCRSRRSPARRATAT